jgi:tryptophan 2,3-dioxygenase
MAPAATGRGKRGAMAKASYWDYIGVERLLALQGGLSGDEAQVSNDEMLFIVVHQVYELWFKLTLRELTAARDFFHLDPVPDHRLASAVRALRRACVVLRQAVSHFELVETLTTRDFLAFRDNLVPASGFQSAQLREIEILLGLREEERINSASYLEALRPDGQNSPAFDRVARRLADGPSFKHVLDEWLYRTPIDGSRLQDPGDDAAVGRFVDRFLASYQAEAQRRLGQVSLQTSDPEAAARLQDRYRAEIEQTERFLRATDEPDLDDDARRKQRRVRAALVFIESYRDLPLLAWPREVVDAVVGFEQEFILFRQRHARMVERVIGRRIGTGGSSGVDYLDQTALRYRIFRNFWAVRTILLRESALPALEHEGTYGFTFDK